jgi:hypothetical protein
MRTLVILAISVTIQLIAKMIVRGIPETSANAPWWRSRLG